MRGLELSREPSPPLNVFFSYSHRDEHLRDELEKHLALLRRSGAIRSWHDRKIGAGENWKGVLDEHLAKADLIVLLISADFLNSDYCFDVEMKYALDKQARGEIEVVPIIIRPVDWEHSPFSHLQLLPRDGRPVSRYQDQDVALEAIARELRSLVSRMRDVAPRPVNPATCGTEERTHGYRQFLPITPESPLLLGLLVDVSGSMQTSMTNSRGPDESRLEAVLNAIKRQGGASAEWRRDPEITSRLDLIKVFAYGFGFDDRAAEFGSVTSALSSLFRLPVPPTPSEVYRGPVRDLLQIGGLGQNAVPLRTLGDRWQDLEAKLWEQRLDMFGSTPFQTAMAVAYQRFLDELRRYDGVPRSALIIVSDGDTDDSPFEDCRRVTELGTTVISAYLTSANIGEPRRLYAEALPHWQKGAHTLFSMSSSIGENGAAVSLLRAKGWEVSLFDRLFLQINHSDIVSEFVSAVITAETGAPPDNRVAESVS